MLPSSGCLLPCSLVEKKFEKPQNSGEKSTRGGLVHIIQKDRFY